MSKWIYDRRGAAALGRAWRRPVVLWVGATARCALGTDGIVISHTAGAGAGGVRAWPAMARHSRVGTCAPACVIRPGSAACMALSLRRQLPDADQAN